MSATPDATVPWDETLLRGFGFACQPGCGLCCYTEPRLTRLESARLAAGPGQLPMVRRPDGDSHLASYDRGGSCRLLVDCRCSIRDRRPEVCVRFPVHIHGGPHGWQASLVFSCPGLSLDPLGEWSRHVPDGPEPRGLDEERASARATISSAESRAAWSEAGRRRSSAERRLRRVGRWMEAGDLRALLDPSKLRPTPDDFPGEVPPESESGAEYLPIFYDRRPGPVAISEHPAGWQLQEISPRGGWAGWTEEVPVPDRVPPLESGAERLLTGYLRYWIARDAFLDRVLWEAVQVEDDDSLGDLAAAEVRWIGATVLARARVRARVRGRFAERLSESDLRLGIAATDADLLDRLDLGARP